MLALREVSGRGDSSNYEAGEQGIAGVARSWSSGEAPTPLTRCWRAGGQPLSSLVLFLRDHAPLLSSPLPPPNACFANVSLPQLCPAPHVSHECSHPSHNSTSPVHCSLKSTSPGFPLGPGPYFQPVIWTSSPAELGSRPSSCPKALTPPILMGLP